MSDYNEDGFGNDPENTEDDYDESVLMIIYSLLGKNGPLETLVREVSEEIDNHGKIKKVFFHVAEKENLKKDELVIFGELLAHLAVAYPHLVFGLSYGLLRQEELDKVFIDIRDELLDQIPSEEDEGYFDTPDININMRFLDGQEFPSSTIFHWIDTDTPWLQKKIYLN